MPLNIPEDDSIARYETKKHQASIYKNYWGNRKEASNLSDTNKEGEK